MDCELNCVPADGGCLQACKASPLTTGHVHMVGSNVRPDHPLFLLPRLQHRLCIHPLCRRRPSHLLCEQLCHRCSVDFWVGAGVVWGCHTRLLRSAVGGFACCVHCMRTSAWAHQQPRQHVRQMSAALLAFGHLQGSEASFTIQRAPLWYGGYTKEDVMWPYIKAMVHYRCVGCGPRPGALTIAQQHAAHAHAAHARDSHISRLQEGRAGRAV